MSDSIRGSTEHNSSLEEPLCSNQHLALARWDRFTTYLQATAPFNPNHLSLQLLSE
jgi:hypothetical protein